MKTLKFAILKTLPICFAYIFIGIAFGVLMSEAGYGVGLSLMSAVFIYAGSMQIVMVALLESGISFLFMAIMTLVVNARHIFYGIGFLEKFRKMGWRYPYMIFSLTDETYSILCSLKCPKGIGEKNALFLIALLNHIYWIFGCVIGSIAGRVLPFNMQGIEFSATAFFLVVCVNQWRQEKSHLPAIVGLISAVIFRLIIGADNFLVPALAASAVVVMILRDKIEERA